MLKVCKIALWILVFLTLYFFLKTVIMTIALSSVAVVEIDAEFDHDDQISVYYSTGLGRALFIEKNSVRSTVFEKNKRSYKKIYLHNSIAKKLRIDTGNERGTLKIYKIVIDSFFGSKIILNSKDIYHQFQPNSSINIFKLNEDHLVLSSNDNDPYLIFKDSLLFKNDILKYFVPFCFSIVIITLLSSISFKTFPAFLDIHNKKPTTGINYAVLDGIRGLAAILVLCEHAGVMNGVGALGVWLFFSLSGFLLSIPFIYSPEKAVSFDYYKTYTVRRIMRIIPMYYSFITIFYLFRGHEITAFHHYLFLQGNIHLWTIPQEMLFYLILPLVMFVGYFVTWKRKELFLVYILALILVFNLYVTQNIIALYGYDKNMKFLAGVFLSGVFFSYLFHRVRTLKHFKLFERSVFYGLASLGGLLLLLVMTLASAGFIKGIGNANNNPEIYGFLAAVVIFLVIVAADSRSSHVFSFLPLRAVGIVGFSYYLLHPLVIWSVQGAADSLLNYRPSGLIMFFTAGIISYLLAAITYTYIERPFLKITSEK